MNNDLIVKSNKLIDAKYNLSLQQIKFINLMISKLDKDATTFFKMEFKTAELLNTMNIDRRNISKLKTNLSGLRQKTVILINDTDTYAECGFLSYFKIDGETGYTTIKFEEEMTSLLLNLKKNFTKLSLEKILNFNSVYSIRIYEILEKHASLLKKYKNTKLINFEIKLDELKEILIGSYNIKSKKIEIPTSYSNYGMFKKRVLETAHAELKAKGDYYFEYEPVKTSRKITSIIFKIMTNKDKIKKDFKEKKKKNLLNGKEKQVALEQIRRIIERSKGIRDPLKYEQALFTKYLKGDLNYDKDLQQIKDSMDREELTNIIKQYKDITEAEEQDKKIEDRKERVEKFKANLKNDKE